MRNRTSLKQGQKGLTPLETPKSNKKSGRLHKSLTGFTIVELLIATAIFSVILLLCATAIIQIGRIYHKGIISARTQEVARTAADEISRAIQFVGVQVVYDHQLSHPGGSTARGFCLDGKLYSYVVGKRKVDTVTDPPTQSKYVFVVNDTASCIAGTTVQPIDIATPTGRELLGDNMRLAEDPAPTPVGAGGPLYRIRLNVIFGEDDLIEGVAPNQVCRTTRFGGQFCAVSSLNTVVEKRVE